LKNICGYTKRNNATHAKQQMSTQQPFKVSKEITSQVISLVCMVDAQHITSFMDAETIENLVNIKPFLYQYFKHRFSKYPYSFLQSLCEFDNGRVSCVLSEFNEQREILTISKLFPFYTLLTSEEQLVFKIRKTINQRNAYEMYISHNNFKTINYILQYENDKPNKCFIDWLPAHNDIYMYDYDTDSYWYNHIQYFDECNPSHISHSALYECYDIHPSDFMD
jgi:hypothetical protein